MPRLSYFLLPSVLVLAGCASVSVRPGQTSASPTLRAMPPRQILISDFDFNRSKVQADRTGKDLVDFERKMASDLSDDLLHSLGPLGIPAHEIGDTASVQTAPQAAWLIRGQFKDVVQGSRALRSLVGFGSGRTKLETDVEIYDLSLSTQAPLLTFQTTGGSGSEPGALLSLNPVGLAIGGGGKAIVTGLSADSKRTARMIAAYLSSALATRGYIAPDKVRKAKIEETDSEKISMLP